MWSFRPVFNISILRWGRSGKAHYHIFLVTATGFFLCLFMHFKDKKGTHFDSTPKFIKPTFLLVLCEFKILICGWPDREG
jgi:hypothetical protein